MEQCLDTLRDQIDEYQLGLFVDLSIRPVATTEQLVATDRRLVFVVSVK